MAELKTTVFLTDDKGNEHKFGPGDKLPSWAASALKESWGDRDDLWDPSRSVQETAVESPAADQKDGDPVEGAKADNAKAREQAQRGK